MEARAIVRNVRMTPRKMKLICDLIRGKDAGTAMAIIMNTPKAASEAVSYTHLDVYKRQVPRSHPSRRATVQPHRTAVPTRAVHRPSRMTAQALRLRPSCRFLPRRATARQPQTAIPFRRK